MSRALSLTGWQVRYELRSFTRDRRRTVFSFMFPVMLVLFFGALNQGQKIPTRGDIPFLTFYVPGIVAYGVMTSTFSTLLISLAAAREHGILKRVQGTPLPWWAFLGGRIGASICVTGAMMLTTIGLGHFLYGVPVRLSTLPAFAVTLVLGTACFTALGIAAVRFAPSADSAGPMQGLIVFPLSFVSNVFFPLDGAPGWLDTVSKSLPLRPLADGLQHAFDPRTHGLGFSGGDLLTLALWTAAGAWLMMRFLRAEAALR